jgi:hypothetical protein
MSWVRELKKIIDRLNARLCSPEEIEARLERNRERNRRLFNLATDFVINEELVKFVKCPPHVKVPEDVGLPPGATVEDYYVALMEGQKLEDVEKVLLFTDGEWDTSEE